MLIIRKITKFLDLYSRITSAKIREITESITQQSSRKHAILFSNAPDYPSSAASSSQALAITALGATETVSRLLEVGQINNLTPTMYSDLEKRVRNSGAQDLEKILRDQFDRNGSDKGSTHGYSNLYALLLAPLLSSEKIRILEIGLGTNRTSVPSNMGIGGVPGASLRSWVATSEKVEVVGLDVDSKVLFQEPRISTHYVDQLKPKTWLDLPESILGDGFDVIIDDGCTLHWLTSTH